MARVSGLCDLCCYYTVLRLQHLMVQPASGAKNYFVVRKVLKHELEFVAAAYAFNLQLRFLLVFEVF
jgi:hypothetical protein